MRPRSYLSGKQSGQLPAILCLLDSHSELPSLPCSLYKTFLPHKGCLPPHCLKSLSFFACLQPLPPQIYIQGPCQIETSSCSKCSHDGVMCQGVSDETYHHSCVYGSSWQCTVCLCCCAHTVADVMRGLAYTFHRALEILFGFGMLRSAAAVLCKPPLLCRVE